MNVLDAFYHLVHDYEGGAPALAVRMGMSKNTLLHKADPKCATHRPAIDELLAEYTRVTGSTNRFGFPAWWASQVRGCQRDIGFHAFEAAPCDARRRLVLMRVRQLPGFRRQGSILERILRAAA